MEPAENVTTLGQMPLGSRLLFRAREDWRLASITRVSEEMIFLSVISPSGRSYRVRRQPTIEVGHRDSLYFLNSDEFQFTSDALAMYDVRW